MEERGVAFMFTSFGIVRGVLLFKTDLSFSKLAFWCLAEGIGGVLSTFGGCPCSLRWDVVRGCAVNVIVSDGGLSCSLLPVSSLNT